MRSYTTNGPALSLLLSGTFPKPPNYELYVSLFLTFIILTELIEIVLHNMNCSAYNEIATMPSIEQTIRVGTADVEMVVQAANNSTGI